MEGVERETVLKIQQMLHSHNVLVKIFKSAIDNWPSDNYKVVIHADRTPCGEHERRYNAPMVNEVAVLVTGEPCSPQDIVLRAHDNTLQRIADTHKFYNALQYPLIFSKGEPGYHFNIAVVNPTAEQPIPSKNVSCMDFSAYYMMLREHNFNLLLRTRQHFHQFLVEMYIKVERERLRYIAVNQKKLRELKIIYIYKMRLARMIIHWCAKIKDETVFSI
ncbi:helitron_like_N domain-containing protein [Trichonephila clavipes]|nr:helitron_like_N domain-containing protein [Trichonephila clavipes]